MKRTELKRYTTLKCGVKHVKAMTRKAIDWTRPRVPPKPMKAKPHRLTAYEKHWQRAVLSLGYCVLCGKYGVQWAHRNEGKGMGKKMPPDQTAALCPSCHHDIDNGNRLSNSDRRSLMDHAIIATHEALLSLGRFPPPPPKDAT